MPEVIQLSDVAVAMLEEVRKKQHVTFVELERVFERITGTSPSGTLSWDIFPNGILWADVNKEFLDAVEEIRPSTELRETTPLTYMIDGAVVSIPQAKRMPKNLKKGYAKPRWLPVVFNLKSQPLKG